MPARRRDCLLLRLSEPEPGRLQTTGFHLVPCLGLQPPCQSTSGRLLRLTVRFQADPRSWVPCPTRALGSGPPRRSSTGPHFFLPDLEPASFRLAPVWGICPDLA
ncbi:hypothetical protein NDU88_003275 [Pleurodeles waltl]|uniref:Uncharacterized protein n=1 Tax=Pleurodeles waltl TaxID=8319 RepID=A0AAV7W6F1_PLEWA|nr:hypothetical protein NDU88_003275 [Pleurodeles waltl]